jgi:endogenous inhibitor of DNA gyrase (YacG/DUF329 family)
MLKTSIMAAPSKCPICKREIPACEGAPPFGPFCSPRCRSIDLGSWLDGRYSIPATPEETEDEVDLTPEGEDDKS